jgi:ribose/xylose/arabinose/galactoside ABC-type transport system permease subunit
MPLEESDMQFIWEKYGIVLALVGEIIIFSFLSENFFTRENIINIANQATFIGIIAVGMTFVIISAGIDLSVGSVFALVGIMTAGVLILESIPIGLRLPLAVLSGLITGICCGAFSGLMISRFQVAPFIATLAMMTICRGLASLSPPIFGHGLRTQATIAGLPEPFSIIGKGSLMNIPVPVIIMASVFLLCGIILHQSPFGRYIYAIGGNEEAARLSGINISRVKMQVYILSGGLTALNSIILASKMEVGDPKVGMLYELDAIAAVVVGGTSLMGGKGTLLGTFIGTMIIQVLYNGLNLVGVSSFLQKVIIGLVILAAVLLDQIKKKR